MGEGRFAGHVAVQPFPYATEFTLSEGAGAREESSGRSRRTCARSSRGEGAARGPAGRGRVLCRRPVEGPRRGVDARGGFAGRNAQRPIDHGACGCAPELARVTGPEIPSTCSGSDRCCVRNSSRHRACAGRRARDPARGRGIPLAALRLPFGEGRGGGGGRRGRPAGPARPFASRSSGVFIWCARPRTRHLTCPTPAAPLRSRSPLRCEIHVHPGRGRVRGHGPVTSRSSSPRNCAPRVPRSRNRSAARPAYRRRPDGSLTLISSVQ